MSGPAVIDVPPSQPDPVREPEGDPGQADALATTLFRVAGRYADFAEEAAQLQGLGGGWYGPAYDAYLGAASRASGEHDTMATTVRRVAQAVSAYDDTACASTGAPGRTRSTPAPRSTATVTSCSRTSVPPRTSTSR